MSSASPVVINCELVSETELAYLVDMDGERFWVPKSKCTYDENEEELTIPEWLALDKGMI